MALISLVYSRYPGSAMALAKVLFFVIVPVFIIGPVAGAYVDRWDRKKVMIIADLLRGILVLTIPVFVHFDLMIPVYIAVFLIFSATRFFLPSKMAFIPAIVPKEKLMVANSLANTTRMLATVFGFAIAGFIVKWVGYMWGFYLDSLSYFASAALITIITPKKEIIQANVKEELQMTKELIEQSIRTNVWTEIVEGFGHIFKKDKMKVVTSSLFFIMAGAGSIFCIILVFIQETFNAGTEALGIFGSFLGVGLLTGTVLFGKYGQKFSKINTMFVSFALCGIAISVFAVYSNADPLFTVGAALIMLIGMAVAPILTCTNTLMHILVPDKVRGRIFSSMEVVMHLAFLIFMFLTAYLAKYFSGFSILLASGIFFASVGILGRILVREEDLY